MGNRGLFLAIVLSTLVIIITSYFRQRDDSNVSEPQNQTETQALVQQSLLVPLDDQATNEEFEVETDVYIARFSTKNAAVVSLKRKEYIASRGQETVVEIFPKIKDKGAFAIQFGQKDWNDEFNATYYNYEILGKSIRFTKDFVIQNQRVSVEKLYTFYENEDLFELSVLMRTEEGKVLPLPDKSYTLMVGPQIGPEPEVDEGQKSRRTSQRRLLSYNGQKTKNYNIRKNRQSEITNFYKWIALGGRYFSVIVFPNSASYTTVSSGYDVEGLVAGAQLSLQRRDISQSFLNDTYRIYVGPNKKSSLSRYSDTEQNSIGISNAEFEKLIPRRLLGFLERIIKFLMLQIYKLVPNYGVVIIIVTILIRLSLMPLLKKSQRSSLKMRSLAPEMQKIKEKYPDDRQKQQLETMELYKKHNFSPFSSITPILFQFPFFIAVYRVFYESIELWQEPFFGWIYDLSKPDVLVSFGDFVVPLLGWNALHLLPVLMLITQYISSIAMMKTQGTAVSSSGMKFFTYFFPIFIVFLLYSTPSGLVLYWIVSNLFTLVTQPGLLFKIKEEEPAKVKSKPKRLTLEQALKARLKNQKK